jgi:hypothetical protein
VREWCTKGVGLGICNGPEGVTQETDLIFHGLFNFHHRPWYETGRRFVIQRRSCSFKFRATLCVCVCVCPVHFGKFSI